MYVVEVIPAKRWRNVKTGQTASLYGAVPYHSTDKTDWALEVTGYTWRKSDGTIGLGRTPAETKDEAIEIMRTINERYIDSFVRRIPGAEKYEINWSGNLLTVYFDNVHTKQFDLNSI